LVPLDFELEESLLEALDESLPEELVLDEPPSPLEEELLPPPSEEPDEPSEEAEPFRPPLLP
jgi:hypothetical protein